MGVPSSNMTPTAATFPHYSKPGAFPHDYIRENGFSLPPSEEQIICTVYQKTPAEHQERLRNGLRSYIDWRCSTSEGLCQNFDHSVKSDTLHLCTHMGKNGQVPDKKTLAEFSNALESNGITRLDLLWNMRSYRKWFDATPGMITNELAA